MISANLEVIWEMSPRLLSVREPRPSSSYLGMIAGENAYPMFEQQIERILEVLKAVARLNECCNRDKALLATRGSESLLNFLLCSRLKGGFLERRINEELRLIDIVAYGECGKPRIAIEAKYVPLKNLISMQSYLDKKQPMTGDFGNKIGKIVKDKEKLGRMPEIYRNTVTSFILIWFCNPYNYVPLDAFLHAQEGNAPECLLPREDDLPCVEKHRLIDWNKKASEQILNHLNREFFYYFDIYDICPVDDYLFPENYEFHQTTKNIGVHCACSVFPLIEVECISAFRTAWQKRTASFPIFPIVRR